MLTSSLVFTHIFLGSLIRLIPALALLNFISAKATGVAVGFIPLTLIGAGVGCFISGKKYEHFGREDMIWVEIMLASIFCSLAALIVPLVMLFIYMWFMEASRYFIGLWSDISLLSWWFVAAFLTCICAIKMSPAAQSDVG